MNVHFGSRVCENPGSEKPVEKSYRFFFAFASMWRKLAARCLKISLRWHSIPINRKFFGFSHTLGRFLPFTAVITLG